MSSDEQVPANGSSDDEQLLPESDNEANINQEELDEDARDLFDEGGDEAGEEAGSPVGEDEEATVQKQIVEHEYPTTLYRHPIPNSSDGETYLFRVPPFLSVDPIGFTLQQFQPPEDPNAVDGKPTPGFSAYETAMSTIRWRRSPSHPEEKQSNARILRWSDGSLTLQLASDPLNQYVIQADRLAPRQLNPKKPTPVSIIDKSNRTGRPYVRRDDTSAYLFSPSVTSVALRATNKLTATLSVQPNNKKNDEALLRLQELTKAANQAKIGGGGAFKLEETLEDPEMARKRAEQAEKEKQRAQRRAETAQSKAIARNASVLGRSGLGRSGGLSAADLEGDELGMGYGRRAGARAPRGRGANRRGGRSESEEDDYEDEDDQGFIAKDDEEEEDDDDESEEDELERQEAEIEKIEREQRTPKKQAATGLKRATPEGGEDPVVEGSPVSRAKRRRVIDEDEDE